MTRKMTILIIEVDLDMLQAMGEFLEIEDYETLRTDSGVQGINLAIQHHPDLILCASNISDISRPELIQQFRTNEETKSIPVVLLLGLRDKDFRESLRASDVNDWLPKPFTTKELIEVINRQGRKFYF